MSERSQTPTPEGEYFEGARFAGLSFVLGLVAVIALVLCAIGALVNPHQFSYSFSSRYAPAASSGRSCIMPPMPTGVSWCDGSWKILAHC